MLTDGQVVRLRQAPVALWHVGNATGNVRSWAVHVMLGPGQAMTDVQAAGVTRLFDALRAESGMVRANVLGHCEWPRIQGDPERTAPTPSAPLGRAGARAPRCSPSSQRIGRSWMCRPSPAATA